MEYQAMTIHSLRSHVRPDTLTNQVRTSQSFARRLYLGLLLVGGIWIGMQFFGPMILLDADGLVLKERELVTTSYPAQVLSVNVQPGDTVATGQPVATVISSQMLTLISELTEKLSGMQARVIQISSRIEAINQMMPLANKRMRDSAEAVRAIEKAKAGGFTTSTRQAEVTAARYAAIRETSGLVAELSTLQSEQKAVAENVARIKDALDKANDSYRNGVVIARVGGTIGANVVTQGAVVNPGEAVAEIHHGRKYVLAYLPTNRLYALDAEQSVVVTDGVNRQPGTIRRIESITDKIPAEFQSNFRSTDRQQVVKIALDQSDVFPVLAKVKVTNPYAPSNLLASFRTAAVGQVTQAYAWLSGTSAHAEAAPPAPSEQTPAETESADPVGPPAPAGRMSHRAH
jgi:multidrug efflux pump subunit AcrA (membrane-fusion protein)